MRRDRLVDKLLETFPDHRLVISTRTKTGQELAQKIFAEKADAIVYFPFDWKFSVRRALTNFKPSLVLLDGDRDLAEVYSRGETDPVLRSRS